MLEIIKFVCVCWWLSTYAEKYDENRKIRVFFTDTSYSYHPAIHDDTFVRRKQRRNRTTFTLQQVLTE